jgi:hypothetical protein
VVIGVLKKGLTSALPVIILFFLLFIVLSFFSSSSLKSDDYDGVLYRILQQNLKSVFAITLINILCFGIGAVLISVYTIREEVVEKLNYVPSFLYVFFGAITLNNSLLHPSLIANIFILLSLISITETYREEQVLSKIFNGALYTSLATFFYVNYSFFILFYFIALLILRPFNWREWVITLLGLIAPVFTYFCIGYLVNIPFTDFFTQILSLFANFQKPLLSEYFYPLFFCLLILLLLGAGKHFTRGLGGKIKTQKNLGLMYWLLLLSMVNFFSKNNNSYFPLIASVIPISVLLSDYFYSIKQLKISNTLLFLLLASGALLFLTNLALI